MAGGALNKNIQYLKGVGEQRARLLNKLGVDTIGALLRLFPRSYIDLRAPVKLCDAPQDESAAVLVTILSSRPAARLPGGRTLAKLTAEGDGCFVDLSFFNNPYTPKKLIPGESYLLYGRFTGSLARRECINPTIITKSDMGGLMPVYPATGGLSSRSIARYMKAALELANDEITETLPAALIKQYSLLPAREAYEKIHFPTSFAEADSARARFAFEQLLTLNLGFALLRERAKSESGLPFCCCDPAAFIQSLPFAPTGAQRRCINEIAGDLAKPFPMNRLLQGDVGSGKTAVAAAAVYCAFKSGYQSAFMAPSEILAAQHAETLHRMLSPFGVRSALLTSAVKGAQRKKLLAELAAGRIDLLIGTHALIGTSVVYSRLGLVVTDEQHRFGVEQRARLGQKGDHPHMLFLSATPIPRSLSLVIYGELDISAIDELPPGRKPVKTVLVNTSYRPRYLEFVRRNARAGFGTYIVCPIIEDSAAMTELESAAGYFEALKKQLPELRLALLHGRIKSSEKADIIKSFAEGRVDVLVSTTVVEVGVDISHATVMIIENAERYGLSDLHQLRGRVGRGRDESWCVLVSDAKGRDTTERLKFLCSTTDGFKIAEYDLSRRGPGDFFGRRQHGLPELELEDTLGDGRMLSAAARAAGEIIAADPTLSQQDNLLLRRAVDILFENNADFN